MKGILKKEQLAVDSRGFVISDKWLHLVVFVLAVIVGAFWLVLVPDLRKDHAATLSAVASFATFYALIFAIIELRRTKAAEKLAANAAARVYSSVAGLGAAQEVTECRATVIAALQMIDDSRAVPSATVGQIVRLYSQIYHRELKAHSARYVLCRSTLDSYMYNPNVARGIDHRSTKTTLLKVLGQLGELQGTTGNFMEYGK